MYHSLSVRSRLGKKAVWLVLLKTATMSAYVCICSACVQCTLNNTSTACRGSKRAKAFHIVPLLSRVYIERVRISAAEAGGWEITWKECNVVGFGRVYLYC